MQPNFSVWKGYTDAYAGNSGRAKAFKIIFYLFVIALIISVVYNFLVDYTYMDVAKVRMSSLLEYAAGGLAVAYLILLITSKKKEIVPVLLLDDHLVFGEISVELTNIKKIVITKKKLVIYRNGGDLKLPFPLVLGTEDTVATVMEDFSKSKQITFVNKR